MENFDLYINSILAVIYLTKLQNLINLPVMNERDTESRYQIRDWTEYLYLIQYMFSTYLKVVKEEENFRKQKFLRLG